MKVSKRGRTYSFRFDSTKKDQASAVVLLQAMSGKPVDLKKVIPDSREKAKRRG